MPVGVPELSDEELGAIFRTFQTVPAVKNQLPTPLPPAPSPKTEARLIGLGPRRTLHRGERSTAEEVCAVRAPQRTTAASAGPEQAEIRDDRVASSARAPRGARLKKIA